MVANTFNLSIFRDSSNNSFCSFIICLVSSMDSGVSVVKAMETEDSCLPKPSSSELDEDTTTGFYNNSVT